MATGIGAVALYLALALSRVNDLSTETHETLCYEKGYTKDDIDILARIVMSEASVLPFEGKEAVAEAVINRAEKYGETIEETSHNGVSTQDNGEPNEDCYLAVYQAILFEKHPDTLLYWRTDYPHSWADEYMRIGNTVFCTERKSK